MENGTVDFILQKEKAVKCRVGIFLSRVCKFGTRMKLLGIKTPEPPYKEPPPHFFVFPHDTRSPL